MEELKDIIKRFAESDWDLISVPAKQWLEGEIDNSDLISVIKKAVSKCGSCGCDFDALYKRALELLNDSVSTIKSSDK